MDYAKIEVKMKENYAAVARLYRENDEKDIVGPDHRRIAGILAAVCCAFHRPISVLDIGCGTGRYFHSLNNVRKLVGMDVSEEMLEEARNPVCASEMSVPEVQLKCDNFYTKDFPAGSFDFIYSVGVFGNGCDLTPAVCDKFHDWLSPDGCLFLDAIDSSGTPWLWRMRKRAKHFVYELLPSHLQQAWDEKTGWLPFFVTSQRHIEQMLRRTKFRHFSVQSKPYYLPLGIGKKLECFASKIPRSFHEPELFESPLILA